MWELNGERTCRNAVRRSVLILKEELKFQIVISNRIVGFLHFLKEDLRKLCRNVQKVITTFCAAKLVLYVAILGPPTGHQCQNARSQ